MLQKKIHKRFEKKWVYQPQSPLHIRNFDPFKNDHLDLRPKFASSGSTWTTWCRGLDAQALPSQSYLLALLLLLLMLMPLLLLEHRFLARVQRRLAHIIPPITTKTNWCLHSHLKKTRIHKAHVLKMKKKCSPKQTKFLSIGYVMNRARNSNSREKIQ